jgi:hypothetical protein
MSSGLSSSNSSAAVSDLISQWGTNCISSCVLGFSKIGITSNLSNIFSHTALLLLKKEINYDEEDDNIILNEIGILIEYGNYSFDKEKDKVRNGIVKYHYDNKGGLRYYIKKYGEFIDEFGDIGYIDLNIHADNQMTFNAFINKVAKKEDNKWIQSNYSSCFDFNCQTFTIEALKVLKPYFNSSNIFPRDPNLASKKSKKKLDFIRSNLKDELNKFYK